MISKQEALNLSPYMALYELIIPKDNMLRQINELVDFSFILDELKSIQVIYFQRYRHDLSFLSFHTNSRHRRHCDVRSQIDRLDWIKRGY